MRMNAIRARGTPPWLERRSRCRQLRGRLGASFGDADAVHYPLTVPVPAARRQAVLTLLDVQHLDLPQLFPRGERLFRRLKGSRRIFSRFEKLDVMFMAFINFALIADGLR